MDARLVTEHARIRMQQRGIPQAALEVLLDYGREAHDHRGCVIVLFDKQARRRLATEMARKRLKIPGRWLDAYAVIAEDAAVVTVGHRQRRFARS
jgi:hypothetical protein